MMRRTAALKAFFICYISPLCERKRVQVTLGVGMYVADPSVPTRDFDRLDFVELPRGMRLASVRPPSDYEERRTSRGSQCMGVSSF